MTRECVGGRGYFSGSNDWRVLDGTGRDRTERDEATETGTKRTTHSASDALAMLLARFGYLLALLAVGWLARAAGLLDERRRELVTAAAYYVALPALVFDSTYDQPLIRLLSPTLVVGVWGVIGAMVVVGWVAHRDVPSPAVRSAAVVQSYHTNLGYFGLPLVAATLGETATATASLVLGVGALAQIPLTIAVLVTLADAEVSLRTEVRTILTNPVILALVVGLAAGQVGLSVPAPAGTALGLVASLALPLALLGVGSSLQLDALGADAERTSTVVVLKLLVMPALAWLTFTALGADRPTLQAGVAMLAMPTAVSTYVYVSEHGGDERVASANVIATTLASLATLFVLFGVVL